MPALLTVGARVSAMMSLVSMPARRLAVIMSDEAPSGLLYVLTAEEVPSDTDTGRYLAAGAVRSFWLRTAQGQLAGAVPVAGAELRPCRRRPRRALQRYPQRLFLTFLGDAHALAWPGARPDRSRRPRTSTRQPGLGYVRVLPRAAPAVRPWTYRRQPGATSPSWSSRGRSSGVTAVISRPVSSAPLRGSAPSV